MSEYGGRWLLGAAMLIGFACGAFAQAAPTVEKVEPPSWWAGHTINPVRLLVRGANLAGARVASANKDLKVSNVREGARGDYLFFDVAIDRAARAGRYEFEVATAAGKTRVPFEIAAPLARRIEPVTNDDVIYLVMTDRFSDGDVANNTAVDRTNPRMWHGGDFRGLINRLDYLRELGVTAVWLTPWYDNSDEVTTCDKPWCPMASYHGYGAIDYYAVENHFGTFAELRELVEKANARGIKIVQDQVANHVGFRHPWMKRPPLEGWFTPFAQNRFNNSSLLSPNASAADVENTLKGWFDFSLPDLNQEEPEVARYELQNALWWIEMTGVSGIRQDTIQYMPRWFIRDWSRAILKQYPNFYMVGEVFEEDSAHTAYFQGGRAGWDKIDTNLPSVFDFKLWRTSQEVFTGKRGARALRDVLKYDSLYPNASRVTVMTNNHDTDRFMSLAGATKEGAKLHVAFMLATRGIPQLYYGEEILMTGGHDPDNRKNFPGGWPGDAANKFTREGRTADEQEMFAWTQQWIKLRRENRALREGKTVDIFYDDDTYVFGRKFTEEKKAETVIVGINNSNQPKEVKFSTSQHGISPRLTKGMAVGGTKMLIGNYLTDYVTKDDEHKMIIPPKSVVAVLVEEF